MNVPSVNVVKGGTEMMVLYKGGGGVGRESSLESLPEEPSQAAGWTGLGQQGGHGPEQPGWALIDLQ